MKYHSFISSHGLATCSGFVRPFIVCGRGVKRGGTPLPTCPKQHRNPASIVRFSESRPSVTYKAIENRIEKTTLTFVVEPDGPAVYCGDNNQIKISGKFSDMQLRPSSIEREGRP